MGLRASHILSAGREAALDMPQTSGGRPRRHSAAVVTFGHSFRSSGRQSRTTPRTVVNQSGDQPVPHRVTTRRLMRLLNSRPHLQPHRPGAAQRQPHDNPVALQPPQDRSGKHQRAGPSVLQPQRAAWSRCNVHPPGRRKVAHGWLRCLVEQLLALLVGLLCHVNGFPLSCAIRDVDGGLVPLRAAPSDWNHGVAIPRRRYDHTWDPEHHYVTEPCQRVHGLKSRWHLRDAVVRFVK